MRRIRFSTTRPQGDRIHHVTQEDVLVVVQRLPKEVCAALRAVHFNDRSRGGRYLGYASHNRDVALCALPPRLSFTRFLTRGERPERFGARRGRQWPEVAIRRFLLYEVFLHELGHLQVVEPAARSDRQRYALETRAQDFAIEWCNHLWATPFDHPDPVHNPPSAEELAGFGQSD